MRVIPPITIGDAMLLSSTVADVAPIYAAGTTYALNTYVMTGTVGQLFTVWKSLQAGNIGHTPSSSPTWWQNTGTTYAAYDSTHSYAKGERVNDNTLHLVYESQMDANLNQPLATGTAWLKIGPTNKWSAFDQLRNTQTVSPVDIVQTIQLTDRADSIAVVGLDARTITITMTVAGVVKYTVTANLSTRKSLSWKQYYFGKFYSRTSVQYFDLPPYRNATITVTVSKPSTGQRGVGGIFIGTSVYLGRTQYDAVSEGLNYSIITRDDFGNITLQPRRTVPKVNADVFFDKKMTSQVLAIKDQLNGRPAIWSGIDDFTDQYFEPLFVYGPYKEYSLDLKDFDEGKLTLEVEEM